MAFKKGQSGNPKGRPVGAKDLIPRGTLRQAKERLAAEEPDLLFTAMRDSLKDKRQRVGMLGVLAGLEKHQVEVGGPDGQPLLAGPVTFLLQRDADA